MSANLFRRESSAITSPAVAGPMRIKGLTLPVLTLALLNVSIVWTCWLYLTPEFFDTWRWVGFRGPISLIGGDYWAALIMPFMHVGFVHLILNALGLLALGLYTERHFGTWVIALLFLGGSVVGEFMQAELACSSGIGISGFLYAIVSFLWAVRLIDGRRYPWLQTVVLWGATLWLIPGWLFAIFGTLWIIPIKVVEFLVLANEAHAAHGAGLVMGLLVAIGYAVPGRPMLARLLFPASLALVIVSLAYNPWSSAWLLSRGLAAERRDDIAAADGYFSRVRSRNPNGQWDAFIAYYRALPREKLVNF